ncbi:surface lipoprotein assembly modifier [Eikenella sp. Marseille-P7795]|uniref:surface lipoprotein assembly modifier n=1 Tax=Eikenella sp. Marseille-P7795 TaxID=2866577 RepID=UPI001CE492A8|nr:surface lipoprotein assembly modifier [Eikenella sp. Marseille-P7795]
MQRKIIAMAALAAVCAAQHSRADTPEQDQSRFLQSGQQQWLRQLEQGGEKPPAAEAAQRQPRVVTQQDLLQQPQLLANMLVQVLNSRPQPELLADLTALYAQTPNPDTVLLRRAQGMLAKYQGNYAQAVQTYRELAAEQPQDVRIRLDLAAMLTEDKQWRESARLFEAVQREPEVPQAVQNNVQQYLSYISKQQQWQWGGGLSPAFDDNVNNAPPPHCSPFGCSREQPKNAAGVAYSLGLAKNQALGGHHNLRVQLDVSGSNYYWSNKSAYDNAYGRLGAGWLWQDARQRLLVLPFYQFQLSGTDNWEGRKRQNNHTLKMHMWAHAGGVRTEYSRLLTPRWQLHTALDAYRQRYRMQEKAEVYNGWYLGESVSLAWRATQRNTLYAGLNFNQMLPDKGDLPERNGRPGTRPNDAAYRRYGINAGWIHDWDALGGLSSRLNVALGERRFRGSTINIDPVRGFIPERRRDRETQYSAAVWHRNWRILGLTPKLNFSWQRIRSSHVWAGRESKQVFLELEKQF